MHYIPGTRAIFSKGSVKISRNINALSPLQRFANNTYGNYDLDANNFAYN